jgi:hypothetical protein
MRGIENQFVLTPKSELSAFLLVILFFFISWRRNETRGKQTRRPRKKGSSWIQHKVVFENVVVYIFTVN